MAVSLLGTEVADLCIGKPAIRSLPPSATVGDALLALKRFGEPCLSIRSEKSSAPAGRVCMVDIVCYLCRDDNIDSPAAALASPVSNFLPRGATDAPVRRVEPHSSILDALDAILDGGARSLVVPIRSVDGGASARKKLCGGGWSDLCWLTQEDLVRFFVNSIALFSPLPALTVSNLGLIRPAALVVRHHTPALSTLPLVRRALADQTSVAVVTDDGKLVGEISPSTLAHCDEFAAAALCTLSAAELMSYIDLCPSPPDSVLRSIKGRLREKELTGMLELLEDDLSPPSVSSSSSSSCSSASSSSDEDETGTSPRTVRRTRSIGSYSARMSSRSEEAIVCRPGSSLVAVMVQALAHRVSYVWVVDAEDYSLVGIISFPDILSLFRDQLLVQEEEEKEEQQQQPPPQPPPSLC